ncbi:MAG: hexokinase [Spirochaetes bacterium]|nr:hexokinase [Spirochaetota bacterium]
MKTKKQRKPAKKTTKRSTLSADPRKNAIRFLSKHGAYFGDISIKKWSDTFQAEMSRGLAGKKSSLKMIPTYIEADAEHDIPKDKKVVVLDAGGTNFRVATLHFSADSKPVVERFTTHRMPGTERELSKQEFYTAMASHVRPVADAADAISFCFSYPVEMAPSKDGRLIHFTKEVKAKEVEGTFIGEGLNYALGMKKKIIILNDTVATLLAGRASAAHRQFGSFIGFILGTGTNTSYVEHNSKIIKAPSLDKKRSQCINIESGGLNAVPYGTFDDMLDKTTLDRGNYRFEKMVSGRYIGPLAKFAITAACSEGLFSADAVKALSSVGALETKDVNAFITAPLGAQHAFSAVKNENDIRTLWHLFDMLVSRSAILTTINLASVILASGAGTDALQPVCITAEGTTYYRLAGLRRKTEAFMRGFLSGKNERHYEIVSVDNATLIGTAVAGLLN